MLSELQRLSHTSCSTFSLKLLKIWWRYLYIYPREYDMAQKSAFDTRYYSTSVFIKVILLVGLWILPKWKLTPLHNSLMVKTKSGRMGFDSEWMLGDCFGNLHCKSSESGWGKSVSIIKTSRKVLDYPYHLRQVCNYNSRSPCKERSHLPIVNSKLVVFRTTSIQSGHLQLVINCDHCISLYQRER